MPYNNYVELHLVAQVCLQVLTGDFELQEYLKNEYLVLSHPTITSENIHWLLLSC